MIVSNDEILDFLDVTKGYFQITAANDVLKLTYDSGSVTDVVITDGTYEGADLAAELKTRIDIAFSITSTVTYSSRKFTIDVGTSNTIAYTHAGSDAGLTFGFTKDHAAAQKLISDDEAGDPTAIIETIRDSVEAWVQRYCRRNFESQSYSEKYSGRKVLNLKQYPIISISKVSTSVIEVLRICNTAKYSSATVSVSSTGLTLTKDGTANNTVEFATYGTMTKVVDAVNDIGNGWSAVLQSSLYANYKSTELLERYGTNCLDSAWVYLEMPDDGVSDYITWADEGQLQFSSTPSTVYVNYNAGYSSDDMPEDLKLAIKIIVKSIYDKRDQELFGLTSYNIGGVSAGLSIESVPVEALSILSTYSRVLL
jgi:hypothetical protein